MEDEGRDRGGERGGLGSDLNEWWAPATLRARINVGEADADVSSPRRGRRAHPLISRTCSRDNDSFVRSSFAKTSVSVARSPAASNSGSIVAARLEVTRRSRSMKRPNLSQQPDRTRSGVVVASERAAPGGGEMAAWEARAPGRDRHIVLHHLDVSRPYPYLRLWERHGLGAPPSSRPPPTSDRRTSRRRDERDARSARHGGWHRRRDRTPPGPPPAEDDGWDARRAEEAPEPDGADRERERERDRGRDRRDDEDDDAVDETPPRDETAAAAAATTTTTRDARREPLDPSASDAATDAETAATRTALPDDLRDDLRAPPPSSPARGETATAPARDPPPDASARGKPETKTPKSETRAMLTVEEMRALGASAPLTPNATKPPPAAAPSTDDDVDDLRAMLARKRAEMETKEAAVLEASPAAVAPVEREGEGDGVVRYRYSAAELRALNVNCDAPPRGFKEDPGWASSTRHPPRAKRGEKEKRAQREADDAAEARASRATAAVLGVDVRGWSLWANDADADADAARFSERAFAAEAAAVANARALRADAERAAANAREASIREARSRIELMTFPPGAVVAFAEAACAAADALAPGARHDAVCGLVFGTWKRGSAPRSWRASVGFVQPWDGEPSALVAWLRAEASGGDGGGGGGGGMIRPLAWLRTTAACGAALTRDVQAAYGDGGGDDDLADAPPPASRVFVSVDVVATALRGKSGGGAVVEVFDLRTNEACAFELGGADACDDDG